MIVAVGMSNLQYVDLNSSRNLFIIGFSFMVGLTIPQWMGEHPDVIKTGIFFISYSLCDHIICAPFIVLIVKG